jgi:hypothetical protein
VEFAEIANAVRVKKRDTKQKKGFYQSNIAHYVLKLEVITP